MGAPQNLSLFHKGDEVFLAKGSYEGTLGIFLNLRDDPKWADILERSSRVRSHQVDGWNTPSQTRQPENQSPRPTASLERKGR